MASSDEIKKGESKCFYIKDKRTRKKLEIAVFNIEGELYAISNICIHKGGPLSQGLLNGYIVTCPWHGWKYSIKDGKSPHQGGDSVDSFRLKEINNKIYVNTIPSNLGKKVSQPHRRYSTLEESVNNYLKQQKSKIKYNKLSTKKSSIRILGISTTNTNDELAPRKSTSEDALNFALEYSRNNFMSETVLIKLRQLEFKHCEGYYSKNAKACIFPCSISEMNKDDQMIEIYEKMILWANIVLISTPIRWGNASSLYYKMIQRLNCVQNQIITNNKYLIRNKLAGFIIIGGQDNIQHIAGELMTFWSQLGFLFGKFPFVGWSRGWYREDTDHNYEEMTKHIKKYQYQSNKNQTDNNNEFYKDIIKMINGLIELSNLIRQYNYDEKILSY